MPPLHFPGLQLDYRAVRESPPILLPERGEITLLERNRKFKPAFWIIKDQASFCRLWGKSFNRATRHPVQRKHLLHVNVSWEGWIWKGLKYIELGLAIPILFASEQMIYLGNILPALKSENSKMGKNLLYFCARTALDIFRSRWEWGGGFPQKQKIISRKGEGQRKATDNELAQELNVRQMLHLGFKTWIHFFELISFALCKTMPIFPIPIPNM